MKNIVITGSTRGIGLGLATQFLKKGCKVIINGTTEEHVLKAVNNLKQLSPNAFVYGLAGSTANYQDMVKLWDFAKEKLGEIDIWINNAGVPQERKKGWETSVDNYTKVIEVNILGVMNGTKVAFNQMLKQGHGEIYNMEGFGSDGMKQDKMSIYGTSKRAVRYFTHSIEKESKNTPINIGTLSPGMVLTDFLLKSINEHDDDIQEAKKIFNILADDVETVTTFLSTEILKNKKKNPHIAWLTNSKVIYRFLTAKIKKRHVLD